jgi:hypothetical protein
MVASSLTSLDVPASLTSLVLAMTYFDSATSPTANFSCFYPVGTRRWLSPLHYHVIPLNFKNYEFMHSPRSFRRVLMVISAWHTSYTECFCWSLLISRDPEIADFFCWSLQKSGISRDQEKHFAPRRDQQICWSLLISVQEIQRSAKSHFHKETNLAARQRSAEIKIWSLFFYRTTPQ